MCLCKKHSLQESRLNRQQLALSIRLEKGIHIVAIVVNQLQIVVVVGTPLRLRSWRHVLCGGGGGGGGGGGDTFYVIKNNINSLRGDEMQCIAPVAAS